MTYTPQQWLDNVTDAPYGPLNDVRLNHIEAGIVTAGTRADSLRLFNVKDYGAIGNSSTDDYTAIMAAWTAAHAVGGTLFFPSGDYVFSAPLVFAASAHRMQILGTGNAYLRCTFATGDAVTLTGPYLSSISGLSIGSAVTRDAGTYLLKISGLQALSVYDINISTLTGTGAGGLWFYGCNSPRMERCTINTGTMGRNALRLTGSGGAAFSDVFASSFSSTVSPEPTVWMEGQSTSVTFTNCHFGGGGPARSYAISGITSTGADFTVSTSTAHLFQAGEFVVIRGASVAAYNNMWRVASVVGNTIVVASTLNPGAATAGTAELPSACFYVDNTLGSCNESMISNCIFEASAAQVYGTVGAYFNGRGAPLNGGTTITGWTVTGCYIDYGSTGLLLAGQDADGAHEPTTHGYAISNCMFAQKTRAVLLDQVQGVTIDNCSTQDVAAADGVSASCGLYVLAGSGPAAQVRGITVRGNNFGWNRDFGSVGQTLLNYGIVLDGAGIQDLLIQGNQIAGDTAAFGMINTPVVASQRWKIQGNNLASGALPIVNTTFLPSVSSASTIDLTALPFDTLKITGTTSIDTISGGWVGRETTLLFASDLTLLTGGNLAVAGNRHVRAGELVKIVHDGTNWYVAGDPTPSLEQIALAGFGLKAWTFDPTDQAGSGAAGGLATQRIYFTAIPLRAGDVVTNIVVGVTTSAVGAVPTTIKLALYDSTGATRLATTANLNSDAKWTSQGYKTFALAAPYTVTTTGLYLVAALKDGVFAGTDLGILAGAGNAAQPGALGGVFPLGTGGTGNTDLGASFTPSVLTTAATAFWFGVS